jgi:hypothetical protein
MNSHDGFVAVDGSSFYRIDACDQMRPFLMSLTSDCDLWMYVSSTGGLTAGRCSPDASLFPYETDDKLHQLRGISGPVTLLRVRSGNEAVLWEPFAAIKAPGARRALYKTPLGNRIIFEETREDLGLSFRYEWSGCSEYGFVRRCTLAALRGSAEVEVLDGLLNVLAGNISLSVQQAFSCLSNAYTRCEVEPAARLGIFELVSRMSDKAEPAEAFTANVVWLSGLPGAAITLETAHVEEFRAGRAFEPATTLTGRRGALLASARVRVSPQSPAVWALVADAGRDQAAVVALLQKLNKHEPAQLDDALRAAERALATKVAAADGVQVTADQATSAHHGANVLFNIMRGGIFHDGYNVGGADFAAFVQQRNKAAFATHSAWLAKLPQTLSHPQLLRLTAESGDADLERLALEYLPLTFSRRHGDPSRPWNLFNIQVTRDDGSPAIAYQGNWRDIFQNWEALLVSYPHFLLPVIAKFVNASTADGFNPYRVSHDGIDWEVPEENSPWANIGYWGDHQIVYLLRLMGLAERFFPGRLQALLGRAMFSYADVPYRLKGYRELLADPQHTIDFDWSAQRRTAERVARIGADGRLLHGADGALVKVTLLEKLLVPVLAKLSCLLPGGGIWMNTQRPEWNDANNALVGNGLSMVTLYQLRRHVSLLLRLLPAGGEAAVSAAVVAWLGEALQALRAHEPRLAGSFDDAARKALFDALQKGFEHHRAKVYAGSLGAAEPLPYATARQLLTLGLAYLDHSIAAARREDGLYHSYNLLISRGEAGIAVGHLYEMLEGQVAVLASGALSSAQALQVLRALFASRMYREDQQSFMLYPARRLPGFLEKNVLPAEAGANPLLKLLLERGDRSVVVRDAAGALRFAPAHSNNRTLISALDKLEQVEPLRDLVRRHRPSVLDLYEQVFHHRAFTGRSGAMYGYEGIGCIYWHMVAKLLLAVQECCEAARAAGAPPAELEELVSFYRRVRSGLGFNKSARSYGAFPVDPYSHTPGHAGAQQPGMTGQVKEEILTRWGELGVGICGGRLSLSPWLLADEEFLAESTESALGTIKSGELAFTWCGTPIVYRRGMQASIAVHGGGKTQMISGSVLDAQTTSQIIARNGSVERVEVTVA